MTLPLIPTSPVGEVGVQWPEVHYEERSEPHTGEEWCRANEFWRRVDLVILITFEINVINLEFEVVTMTTGRRLAMRQRTPWYEVPRESPGGTSRMRIRSNKGESYYPCEIWR